MKRRILHIPVIALLAIIAISCNSSPESSTATFTNPVLHADYSDPDVVRAGDGYYMVSSSFNCVPGLPVLYSNDLVHWSLKGYALDRLMPEPYFSKVRHGGGVWAPCIRLHNGEYYIYYPDPDHGIFMVRASDPSGPWSKPVTVMSGKGLIDPSPLWDEDGKAYLAYAFAGSRAGVKSVLMVTRMSPDGTGVIGDPVIVFDGHDDNPTVEGPKFYKRNGLYYIFAPAGGVTNGWQLVLRSKNVFGPYEKKVVLHQGQTDVNGPHQGAWVTTGTGSEWFIHFQDKGAYGRIVHLQPLTWADDWPVIGEDKDGDGIGEPVATYAAPDAGSKGVTSFSGPDAGNKEPPVTLQSDDEFNGNTRGLQWQWHANPSITWGYASEAYGAFRLNCIARPDSIVNMWEVPNLLLQKLPAEEFFATAALRCKLRHNGEEAGMIVMGRDYQYISVKRFEDKLWVRVVRCIDADTRATEEVIFEEEWSDGNIVFGVRVAPGAVCTFSYGADNKVLREAGEHFTAREGMWIGAKIGFFALRDGFINDAGYTDIDWFRLNTTD